MFYIQFFYLLKISFLIKETRINKEIIYPYKDVIFSIIFFYYRFFFSISIFCRIFTFVTFPLCYPIRIRIFHINLFFSLNILLALFFLNFTWIIIFIKVLFIVLFEFLDHFLDWDRFVGWRYKRQFVILIWWYFFILCSD